MKLIAIVFVLGVMAALVPVAAAAATQVTQVTQVAQATEVKVLQLNICHSGKVKECFTGDKVMTRAKSVIGSVKPQVLSVNEACRNDVEPLRQAMGAAKAKFIEARESDGSPKKCKNNKDDYGNVIMIVDALAGTTEASDQYSAQDNSNERRVWACLPAGKLTACTTHLSHHDGNIALAQCEELMSRAVEYARTAPTVVSGDMNLQYKGSPNVQKCNRSGFYRKGDGHLQHVFATTSLGFVGGTKVDMEDTTDHPGWLVTMTLG